MPPLSSIDVAVAILKASSPMSSMKLHKLVYYCQAWSLVWDGEPLFLDPIEAWVGGPAVPLLYKASAGKFELRERDLKAQAQVKGRAAETVNAVIAFYGDRESQWLADLVRREAPWREARVGLSPLERGNRLISLESMRAYYSSLIAADED